MVGSDRNVEPSTVSGDEWAYLASLTGLESELYHLKSDPDQVKNVIGEHPEVAKKMREAWLTFLEEHEASESRIKPCLEAEVDVHTPAGGMLYAFRDDLGQWIAFSSEQEAHQAAYHEKAPGPKRSVESVTFGKILNDNPRNLVRLFGQYYWAEDLAK